MICQIYLFDLPYHVDRPFDYRGIDGVRRGSIVKVPFGRSDRLRYGVVFSVCDSLPENTELKSVRSVLPDTFVLTEEMLGLCAFLKEYTLCTFGEAVKTIMPPGFLSDNLNVKITRRVYLKISAEEAQRLLTLAGRAGIKSEGQRQALNFLIGTGSADYELCRALPGVTSSHLNALCDKGITYYEEREFLRNPYEKYSEERDTSPINLSEEQSRAYDTIEGLYLENQPRAALLYGVTGSGKTKVIMKAIDKALLDGKNVIMLVPEISLTPQTVNIFCKRYGDRVAVIHSSLSQGERMDAWRRIRSGEVDLVIGTRSAIFAPLSDIGLIIIDEEHEHTYKSESAPKYHARDVASHRCMTHNALMLLASATPSLESFYKAKNGKYRLVPLRERYGGVRLPTAVIVDMREELRRGNTSSVSGRLLTSLNEVKARGEQAIIFLNRRGYSSQVSCKSCGEVITCPHCSVSLTYHASADGGRLICHMCGYRRNTPKSCDGCGSDKLSFLGFGTQKLEGELARILPEMPVMRMDADTTTGKMAYDKMLDDFRHGESDILLGTQMVAKGHDFPRVTLVGVALADTSLYMSDFRAAERTFSLLTQVIGRAGRASDNGVAVIQTFSPTNETIRLACRQDYDSFYEGEIALRKELSYPPFCDIAQLTITAQDEGALSSAAEKLHLAIMERVKGEYSSLPFVVYGPFEAQVYKLNEKYRMRMILKGRLNGKVRQMLRELLLLFSSDRDTTLAIDLNPLTV